MTKYATITSKTENKTKNNPKFITKQWSQICCAEFTDVLYMLMLCFYYVLGVGPENIYVN